MAIGLPHQLAGARVHGDGLGLATARLAEHAVTRLLGLVAAIGVLGRLAVTLGVILVAAVYALVIVIVIGLVAVRLGGGLGHAEAALDVI